MKELLIDPHIVIEASAFNMCSASRTSNLEYVTFTKGAIYLGVASTSEMFRKQRRLRLGDFLNVFHQLRLPLIKEYDYVVSLCDYSSFIRVLSSKVFDEVDRFCFATTTPLVPVASKHCASYIERVICVSQSVRQICMQYGWSS